jgi:hypothetical protein
MHETLEKLINSPVGVQLKIPCQDKANTLAVRMRCWRYFKRYKEQTKIDPEIIISIPDENTVLLTRQALFKDAIFISSSGGKVKAKDEILNPDRERLIRLMVEDSLSKEEILAKLPDSTKIEWDLIEELTKKEFDFS